MDYFLIVAMVIIAICTVLEIFIERRKEKLRVALIKAQSKQIQDELAELQKVLDRITAAL